MWKTSGSLRVELIFRQTEYQPGVLIDWKESAHSDKLWQVLVDAITSSERRTTHVDY
jgi:hypothetical protein